MKFAVWLNIYILAVQTQCVFTTNELREAWKNGKTPQDVARDNDNLCAEYHEVYGDYADELIAA